MNTRNWMGIFVLMMKIELIQVKLLGFCNCGRMDDNLKYVRNGLQYIDTGNWFAADSGNVDADDKKWTEEGIEIFGNEVSKYFFFYWCDKEGFTEHCGTIPGWLTVDGKDLLNSLNMALNEEGG